MKSTLLNSRMFAMLGVAAALVLGCSATLAATWTGLGSDANWMTSGNWTPGVPAPGDSLIFDGTPSVSPFNNFPAVTPFGGITFPASAGPFTLEGDALELDGSLSNLSGSSQVINCPISLTNVVTFNIGAETTINVISNTGGLVKTGTGTLILNNKTFSGGMTVNSGLVQINNQSGGTVTMSGGSLMLNVRSWWWDNLTVPFTANAEVGIDLPIGSGGNPLGIDFAGSIGSPGFKWTKTGQGIIYVTHWSSDANPTIIVQASSIDIAQGTLANLPNGATDHAIARWGTNAINVAGGAALAATDGTIAFNPVTINGEGTGNNMGALYSARRNNGDATSSNAFLGPITLASDSGIGTFFGKLYLMGNISGPGGFTKLGSDDANSANLLVLGGTNTYNGSTFIATGTVQLASSAALPSGSGKGNLVLNGPSTLDLKGFSASVNGFSDDAAGLAKVENTSTNLVTLTLGGNDQAVSFSGAIKNSGGGALSIAKVGSGAATLLGANTFSGAVSVSGGTLDLNISPGTTTGYAPLIVLTGRS